MINIINIKSIKSIENIINISISNISLININITIKTRFNSYYNTNTTSRAIIS